MRQSSEPGTLSAQSGAQRSAGDRRGSAEPGSETEGTVRGVVEIRQSRQRQRLLQRERRSALHLDRRRSRRRALSSLRQRGDILLIIASLVRIQSFALGVSSLPARDCPFFLLAKIRKLSEKKKKKDKYVRFHTTYNCAFDRQTATAINNALRE